MDIKNYLRDNGVEFEVHTHPARFTAQEVAAAEHVPGRMLAKVVIIQADRRFVMAVLPATQLVDIDKLASVLGADDVRLAEEYEMRNLFPDCETGAEPPFGNLYDIELLVDRQLAMQDHIVFQSGTHRETVRMKYADYDRLARPKVADFAAPAEAPVR
ncbi:MAG TPA: YbaK/EbsC family protein [Planctomycetota bacterium]|nr:YbaK/EbsC family protein [Planctomycetota bacterium]